MRGGEKNPYLRGEIWTCLGSKSNGTEWGRWVISVEKQGLRGSKG